MIFVCSRLVGVPDDRVCCPSLRPYSFFFFSFECLGIKWVDCKMSSFLPTQTNKKKSSTCCGVAHLICMRTP